LPLPAGDVELVISPSGADLQISHISIWSDPIPVTAYDEAVLTWDVSAGDVAVSTVSFAIFLSLWVGIIIFFLGKD
jgi:hypothetical protein